MTLVHRSGAAVGVLTLSVTLALGACGSSSSTGASSPSGAGTSAAASSTTALTFVDGWAKSTDSMPADFKTMTGVFGTLKNSGTEPIAITGASSAAGKMVQMHETVKTASGAMQMQEAKGGFTVPAGGTFELKPGGNHIMIMDLAQDLKVGDDVAIDLTTSAGTVTIKTAVRAFPGAGESYTPRPSTSMSQ